MSSRRERIMTKNSKAVLIIATIIIALIAITAVIHAGFNRSYALAEGEEASEDFFGSVGVYYEGEDETPRYGDEKIELRAYAPANGHYSYTWYYSTQENGVYTEAFSANTEGSIEPTVLYCPVTTCDQNGWYYCKVTETRRGSVVAKTDIDSKKVKLEIAPRQATVKVIPAEYVYNGKWQTLKTEITGGVLEGDKVSVIAASEEAVVNAGEYDITLTPDNKNYVFTGDVNVKMTIKHAKLKIKLDDVHTKTSERHYDYKINYIGFVEGESEKNLSFTPSLPTEVFTATGEYKVKAQGKTVDGNYEIEYEESIVYVNKNIIDGGYVNDADFSAAGSFEPATTLTVEVKESDRVKLPFTKIIVDDVKFTLSATASEDAYTVNIKREYFNFGLSVCYVDKDGNNLKANNFTYRNGVLSVTLPSDVAEGDLVVYYDITLALVLGGLFVLVLFIAIVVVAKDKRKYKRRKILGDAAKKQARKAKYY